MKTMKNIAKVCFASALALAAARCIKADEDKSEQNNWTIVGNDTAWGSTVLMTTEVNGHEYLIVRVHGGVSVVHAASCRCMEKDCHHVSEQ